MTSSTSKFLLELPPISQTESLISLRNILLSHYSFLNTTVYHFVYHQTPVLKTKLKNLLSIYIAGFYSSALSYGLHPSFPTIYQGKTSGFKSSAKTTPAHYQY